MTKQFVIQNNFSHGELDPRVFDVSLDIYYKSVQYMRNLYVRPQGGAQRRHGTEYLETIDTTGSIKLGNYTYDVNTTFMLVWINGILQIYSDNDGVFGPETQVVSPYNDDEIPNVQFAQMGQTLYSVHSDHAPYQLTYDKTANTWAYAAIVFKNAPTYDYLNNYLTAEFNLTAISVTGNTTTLTSTVAVFTSAHEGGIFVGLGDVTNANGAVGVARIKTFTSSTSVEVEVVSAFAASKMNGSTVYLAEVQYSAARGYPNAIGTAQSRLSLGGGSQTPNVINMSKVNDGLNFNLFENSDPDVALQYTLPGENHNHIQWIVSNRSVQIFGNTDSFSTTSELLDPGSMAYSLQTNKGASYKVKPRALDNDVFYVQTGGKAVMRHVFDPRSGTYASSNQSLTASHLINDPIASAVLSGDSLSDADYLFLVNTDGTLAVMQSLAEQNILGWSLCGTGNNIGDLSTMVPTDGKFKDLVSINNMVYALVERTIDFETKFYIERLTYDVATDCTVVQSYQEATKLIKNLEPMEGEKVKVWADGILVQDKIVNGGSISLSFGALNVSVGINVTTLLTPLPVNVIGSHTKYIPKRIVRTWISYYDSIGIYVEGTPIPELVWKDQILGQPTAPKSGIYEERLEGWGSQVTFTISQKDPLPFLVTGIGYEVEL